MYPNEVFLYYKEGVVFTEDEVRALDPTLSLGYPFLPDGYELVYISEKPVLTSLQVIVNGGTAIDIDGKRYTVWNVEDKYHDYYDENNVLVTKLSQEQAQLQIEYTTAIQTNINILSAEVLVHLNTFAASRSYDSIISAITYETSAVPKFAQEGLDCKNARDMVWTWCGQLLDSVLAGQQPIPDVDTFKTMLPVLTWTNP